MRIQIRNPDYPCHSNIYPKKFSNTKYIELEVQNVITIKDLEEKYHNKRPLLYMFNENHLRYDRTLSFYGIKDGDVIECYIPIKSPNTHICPNGCKRYIPDEYQDCDECMNACPYYFL